MASPLPKMKAPAFRKKRNRVSNVRLEPLSASPPGSEKLTGPRDRCAAAG